MRRKDADYRGQTVEVRRYKKGAGVKYPTTGRVSRFGSLEDALGHANWFQDRGARVLLTDRRK